MNTKGKILVVGSSADMFELKDGRKEPMGYYLNELAIPSQAAVDAGGGEHRDVHAADQFGQLFDVLLAVMVGHG